MCLNEFSLDFIKNLNTDESELVGTLVENEKCELLNTCLNNIPFTYY